ncbi:GPI ethanolamine phosphate transferase 2 isoform X1 [Impatiens glandulifera]|nr:GPI ethanolamine phosphate transferase 2 isoform X1 [Impatiens glandulifera]
MVMLGDETWLKLFPGLFQRNDGVSSFFVRDTVQVDHNVSRHLGSELARTDWDLLVLHYLGLDHVGHIGGRNSVLMGPKLTQMDEVIRTIHQRTIHSQGNATPRTLLVVVSDHGMTSSGNHGGSSYEETDSLLLFIGLPEYIEDSDAAIQDSIYQVDIAPTLALLFGVPIPNNNVGIMISEVFHSLREEHQLRALELNAWQLLRLLQAQLPGFCRISLDVTTEVDQWIIVSNCNGNNEEMMCCSYKKAAALHKSWRSKFVSGSNGKEEYKNITAAYRNFLRIASEWLSRRATDKPVGVLISGIVAMVFSCLIFLGLLFCLNQEVYPSVSLHHSKTKGNMLNWQLDEIYILAVVLIVIASMGSSSMVEEEQYIWYFITSTFSLILLRKTIQSSTLTRNSRKVNADSKERSPVYNQVSCIMMILIFGRILRGWHQGGVNWVNLPDISKWLEQEGNNYVRSIQLVASLLVICLILYSLSLLPSSSFVVVVGLSFLVPCCLILQHTIKHEERIIGPSGFDTTNTQTIYSVLGILITMILLVSPWLMPVMNSKMLTAADLSVSTNSVDDMFRNFVPVGYRGTMYVIGWAYVSCWCLLQLVLQQPINSMPVSLLFWDILACICFFANQGPNSKQWVEIAALYFLGMVGHFALGNTNTLATIDVAGAFIGISSHSTALSGILMFIITYASPMLVFLSLVIYISMKTTSSLSLGNLLKKTVGFACLVPLGINSIILLAYTIMLLLMRNHLFVWSVFSPKYLYVCATTICVYIGVFIVFSTAIYSASVISLRVKFLQDTHSNSVNN